jgi:hypothetical protein
VKEMNPHGQRACERERVGAGRAGGPREIGRGDDERALLAGLRLRPPALVVRALGAEYQVDRDTRVEVERV